MKHWWYRRVPTAVALLGGLGLGTTLTYFFGLYLAIAHRGYPAWSAFFSVWGSLLVSVPVVILVAYLGIRSRVGAWLIDRGAYETAVDYASERLRAGLLRSEEEAWRQRIAVVRAELAMGHSQRALDLLESESGRAVGGDRPEWLAWRLELWGRESEDADVDVPDVSIERIESLAVDAPDDVASRLWAVTAELIARGELFGEEDLTAMQAVRRARDRRETSPRVDIAEAVACILASDDDDDWARAAELLEVAAEDVLEEMPQRETELIGLRAEARARTGDRDEASSLLATLKDAGSDPVGDSVVERVRERYGLEGGVSAREVVVCASNKSGYGVDATLDES